MTVGLHPIRDGSGCWLASWAIRENGGSTPTGGSGSAVVFNEMALAARWLEGEARKKGFDGIEPVDLETRIAFGMGYFQRRIDPEH